MPQKATDHIVKSFDEELRRLRDQILAMGGRAEAQLGDAIQALARRDSDKAVRVIESDKGIDALEMTVAQDSLKILALRQPMAKDLREVIAAIKISADIERIGDYAKNIAKRTLQLNQQAPLKPTGSIPRMGELAIKLISAVLSAYANDDAEGLIAAWRSDESIDEMYNSLFRELLTYMMEDPRNIGASTHLLFIAKNIERIGDHATNIAETVHFLVHGKPIDETRPKGDTTNVAIHG
ncbi:phosphate signaling complex protein PhoU [Dongia rigui]|uniref:Phosphate-specific transport system accessory protein PhoU n=1 Tax=Dongia rigui TaxID=940149 RepID=A0ABU5DXS9_9PROT|nr:phosphate signaling complex protein PhoU [Dongia rigui]MDY0871744.1 phosphate signaling complex protein PhoU [Dongia rigui]